MKKAGFESGKRVWKALEREDILKKYHEEIGKYDEYYSKIAKVYKYLLITVIVFGGIREVIRVFKSNIEEYLFKLGIEQDLIIKLKEVANIMSITLVIILLILTVYMMYQSNKGVISKFVERQHEFELKYVLEYFEKKTVIRENVKSYEMGEYGTYLIHFESRESLAIDEDQVRYLDGGEKQEYVTFAISDMDLGGFITVGEEVELYFYRRPNQSEK